jgi:Na+/citrate or Na+/malate symporter
MSGIKRTVEQIIHHILRARNIPESQWSVLVKKTGRGMILTGVVFVVSGVLVDNISLPVTIAIQISYASLICIGALLAFDDEKSERGS